MCQPGEAPSFAVFRQKKEQKVRFQRQNWAKTPYNTAKILTKCNVFYAHIIFFGFFLLLSKNKTKAEILHINWKRQKGEIDQFSKSPFVREF